MEKQPETLEIFVCETFEVVQEKEVIIPEIQKVPTPILSPFIQELHLSCESFFPRGPSVSTLPIFAMAARI